MTIGGFHIGWGLYNIDFYKTETKSNFSNESPIILLAFYIGAIVGNNLALYLIKVKEKKDIFKAAIVFFVISIIPLFVGPHSYYMITTSRFIAGFAHALVYITSLVHASEIALPNLRNSIIFSLHQHLGGSFFTSILMMASSELIPFAIYDLAPAFLIVFVFRGLFVLLVYSIESPIFLMQHNRNADAMKSIIKLRNENVESWETRNQFNDFKSMISEGERSSNSLWKDGNYKTIFIVLTSLLVYVASYNFTLNSVRLSLIENDSRTRFVAPWVTFGARLIFGKIIVFFIDRLKTRFVQLFSGFVAGFGLIITGLIHTLQTKESWLISIIGFASYETFGLMGAGYVSILITSEAFSTTKKCESLCLIYNIENLLHITSIVITRELYRSQEIFLMFVFGTTIVVLTFILYFIMPETNKLSLRKCVEVYKQA